MKCHSGTVYEIAPNPLIFIFPYLAQFQKCFALLPKTATHLYLHVFHNVLRKVQNVTGASDFCDKEFCWKHLESSENFVKFGKLFFFFLRPHKLLPQENNES